ncbi:MAG TPA: citrate synthase [Thiotrichaceae bacterium]|nr:citrate synthase [Thiotrichaceae bacterium]
MAKYTATITDNETGECIELDILHPTQGPKAIDVSQLYKKMGLLTYDPGFMSTASCWSDITYLDGYQGVLEYRGYNINQLAEEGSFMETCFLLLNGELPTQDELAIFTDRVTYHTMLHEQMKRFYSGFRRDAHPMATMVGVVGALSAFYHEYMDISDANSRYEAAILLIAKMPTIAAWSYRYANGTPFVYPDNNLSYSENFLHMMFSLPTGKYEVSPIMARALEVVLITHADHEQNASTSTVRLAGSSEANPFAAIAAGIASLWGAAHGGANEAVVKMLIEIRDSDEDVEYFVEKAKDKNNSFRLMGFGHRVYKNYDPRAKIIRELCHQIIEGGLAREEHKELLEIAMMLEKVALEDDYFIKRKLYPNVDFYSGIIFLSMGIPLNMFTVMFAMARTIGWISHWHEMMGDEKIRISRPRQLYTGRSHRDYVPVDKR